MDKGKYAFRAIFLFNNKPAGRFPGKAGAYYSSRDLSYAASMEYNQLAPRRIMRERLTMEQYAKLVQR